jgi:hypothetical protein
MQAVNYLLCEGKPQAGPDLITPRFYHRAQVPQPTVRTELSGLCPHNIL